MKIRAIITGATGMVGKGVLHECLQDPDVDSILVVNRDPCGVMHSKLTEIIHQNFLDLSKIENGLKGYNACLFCLGVSSIGMNEEQYHRLSYELTIEVADTLDRLNPGMSFCYVSGAGTDSTERGRSMWARVKGKTENQLLRMFPGRAYMFRPGYIHPTPGLRNTLKAYRYMSWLYPLLRRFLPRYASTLAELGRAMINAAKYGYRKPVLEVPDIVALAADSRNKLW